MLLKIIEIVLFLFNIMVRNIYIAEIVSLYTLCTTSLYQLSILPVCLASH